jgi:hypothetical protein
MATNADFYIFVDTVEPNLEVQLVDDDLQPDDLTDASVEFKMSAIGSDQYKVESPAVIDDASEGKVTYAWARSDTDTAGKYHGRFFVDYSDNGSVDEVYPNDDPIVIYVRGDDLNA